MPMPSREGTKNYNQMLPPKILRLKILFNIAAAQTNYVSVNSFPFQKDISFLS